jgi:N-acetylated-alpha-linked acidic dipeptidase
MRIILTLSLLISTYILTRAQSLTGFSRVGSADQREAEKKFDTLLQSANLDMWMKKLSSRPHHVGSEFGKASAEFIRDQFRSWGYEAEIETFHVLFPTPRIRVLEMTAPRKFKARNCPFIIVFLQMVMSLQILCL